MQEDEREEVVPGEDTSAAINDSITAEAEQKLFH